MVGRSASDKRERLVAAAVTSFHHRGYVRTALADVARSAGLSPGHVYYYFRSKEELARAVIDAWCARITVQLSALEGDGDGWRRLERFTDQLMRAQATYVALGCPLASLARDLRHESAVLRAEVPRVYAIQEEWLRAQLAGLGYAPEAAREHARALMVSYHGTVLLAYAQDDAALIADGADSIRTWLRQLRARTPRDELG